MRILDRNSSKLPRPSAAMVVAMIALVLGLGGTATAARILIKSPSQIKNRVVTGKKIKKKAITADLLADGVITKGETGEPGRPGPKGDRGDKGDKGDKGDQGARGPSDVRMYFREHALTVTGTTDAPTVIAQTPQLPAGVHLLQAKLVLQTAEEGSAGAYVGCRLVAGDDSDLAGAAIGEGAGFSQLSTIGLQVAHEFASPGQAHVECLTSNAASPTIAHELKLTVTQVGSVTRAQF